MDPTHFLASRSLENSPSEADVQAFYETHAIASLRPLRSVIARLAARLKRPPVRHAEPATFAVSHPAE